MTSSDVPAVSVIVPARNSAASLPLLLEALDRQTVPEGTFELILVDDGSTDETPALAEGHSHARVIRSPERQGAYAARNLGVMAATAPVLAFTDADCVPRPDWIERGLEQIAERPDRLLAGRIHMPLGDRPSAAAMIDFLRYLDQERAVGDGFGATANLWVSKEVVARVGGFNSKLISGGDTEFGHRAGAAGFGVDYVEEVIVEHPPRSEPRQLARKAYRLGFGAAQHRRHAEGPLRSRTRMYLHPGSYKPTWRIANLERLDTRAVPVTARKRLALCAVHYFCIQLPILAGNISGALDRGPLALRNAERSTGALEPSEQQVSSTG